MSCHQPAGPVGLGNEIQELWQVVACQPEGGGNVGVGIDEHDTAAGDAAHLAKPGGAVGPVMVAQHGHRRVDAAVIEREALRRGSDRARGARSSLSDHGPRWLDRDDLQVNRFVGAAAGADVDDAASISEARSDLRGNARIGVTSG